MKAIKLAGLVALLLASSVMANQVVVSARAVAFDYLGNDVDLSMPIDPADPAHGGGVLLMWTSYVDVSGANQGLAGLVASMGVAKDGAGAGVWAPVQQLDDTGSLYYPAVYKAPGTGANGSIADVAGAGGPGMGKGASRGYPAAGQFYVGQFGAGYLDWSARRYKTSPLPKAWVGDQQWGVGMAARKTNLLAAGAEGTFDVLEGIVDITALPAGTYSAKYDLATMSSKVIAQGVNLNIDQPSVPLIEVAPVQGDVFGFTIVPEPATLLLLAGAGLLYRRRRA